MTTITLKTWYAIGFLLLNLFAGIVTFLATQPSGQQVTYTVLLEAVLAGVEAAIHYEEAQQNPATAAPQDFTTFISQLEQLMTTLTNPKLIAIAQQIAAAQPQTLPPQTTKTGT